jgi:hypothetical protein
MLKKCRERGLAAKVNACLDCSSHYFLPEVVDALQLVVMILEKSGLDKYGGIFA